MKTRKCTPAEEAKYNQMVATSQAWATVWACAQKFYCNGSSWEGLEDESNAHKLACKVWDEERLAAGFSVTVHGLRKIVHQRGVGFVPTKSLSTGC